ncbi:MAG: hypothetical protein KJI69_05525 [Patescibacteria group bacterium]|nr:hypothetical protein [Patescibacteria group bacterium]
MVKGHMEKDGFHPHTDYKGVRKSRDQTAKTEGVRLKRKGQLFKPQESRNVMVGKNEVIIWDDDGVEVAIWVRQEWEEDPSAIPAIRNAIRLANQGKVEEIKKAIDFDKFHPIQEKTRPRHLDRKARYAFDDDEETQEITPDYSVGDIVMVSPDNDNEGYDDFRNKKLRITMVATNRDEHRGFDEGVGQALYELVTLDGEEIGSSLYDYELESA